MSLLFSRQCEYGLQAVLYLALKPEGEMTSIKELSARIGIPYHFLGKILQSLTRKGLLNSLKGPTGGFALALPPKEIKLFHIVEAIDGADFVRKCVLGFPECSGENPCALHETWERLRQEIYQMLVKRDIAALAKAMEKEGYRS
jgi:Rrf2 family transcriptional regulator, iron-sulfur cluster assembly transcription factor